MPDHLQLLDAAERAHRELRSSTPGPANLDAQAALLAQVMPALDAVYNGSPPHRSLAERLRGDAEFFAGLTDAEGYRDPSEVWSGYDTLRSALR